MPNFSQDFYRFIWDGQLILQGQNPYLYSPNELVASGGLTIPHWNEMLQGMGDLSASNNTSYPPINQLFFAIAALFSGKSLLGGVIAIRLLTIGAEIGTFLIGRKLLSHLKLNPNNIYWYFLNPFIIIELTGNLHFEGIMIFFIVWALYLLVTKKWLWSAVVLAIAISVKLLPLLLLPVFFRFLGFKKSLMYYLTAGSTTVLTFVPFLNSELIENFRKTIGLWFVKFEFNASFYYIARWFGYQDTGYNEIAKIGPRLSILALIIIVAIALLRKNERIKTLFVSALFIFVSYYLLSTTVHPWYISIPLILSVFTRYRAVVVWSALVMLSYYTYSTANFEENMFLIMIEYVVFLGYFIFELVRKPNTSLGKKGNN